MNNIKPQIEIIKQPANSGIRFRYLSEKNHSGKLPGEDSDKYNKSYTTLKISGYNGPLQIVVSCVTNDPPYRQHPNILSGKTFSKEGIYYLNLDRNPKIIELNDLKIYRARRQDVRNSLLARKDFNIDPTKAGFSHINQGAQINLDKIRLCFQAYYENDSTKLMTEETEPVISEELFNRRDNILLNIYHISTNDIPLLGGQVMMFTSLISKDDIEIRMIVENSGLKSEKILKGQVHRRAGIIFHIPPYVYPDDKEFKILLRRPSDQMISSPAEFTYSSNISSNTCDAETNTNYPKLDQSTQTNNMLEIPDPTEFLDVEMEENTQDSLEQLLLPKDSDFTREEDINDFQEWLLPFDNID